MKTTQKHWIALTASTLGLAGFSLASGFGDEKYTYDASGNVLEKQIGDQITRYTYTGNQLNGSESDSGSKQYAYDSSGRLTSDSEAGKATRKMVYQYLGKVTKVQNGDKTTEFFYNAEGQLVATNSAGNSEAYAWDGLAIVNRGEQLFVNEAHVVGGAPAIVGNEVAVADILGSSLSVGRGSFQSTAFGEGLTDGLFTGKPFIEDLDVFIFKYRNYSAKNGGWITSDPSGFPDGINNLTYVSGDPINKIDPKGLTEVDYFSTDVTKYVGVSIKIQVKVQWGAEEESSVDKVGGSDKLIGTLNGTLPSGATYEWKSPNSAVSNGVWTNKLAGPNNDPTKDWFWKDVDVDSDASFEETTNGITVASTESFSYKSDTHTLPIEN